MRGASATPHFIARRDFKICTLSACVEEGGWKMKLADKLALYARSIQKSGAGDPSESAVKHAEMPPDAPPRERAFAAKSRVSALPRAIQEAPIVREYRAGPKDGADDAALAEIAALPERYWRCLLEAVNPGAEYTGGLPGLLFFDLETTGLGGAGCYAFIVGTLCLAENGFAMKQFFLPHPAFEASFIDEVAYSFTQYEALVSYNGVNFDAPLLCMRAALQRKEFRMPPVHYDLLHPARAFWSASFEDCRLKTLETEVCAYKRPPGDIDGALIPDYYLQWLRDANLARLEPIFTHNRADLIALLQLAAHMAVIAGEAEADTAARRGGWAKPTTSSLIWLARRALAANDETRARDILLKAADGAGGEQPDSPSGASLRAQDARVYARTGNAYRNSAYQNNNRRRNRRYTRIDAALILVRLLRRHGEYQEAADLLMKLHKKGVFDAFSVITLAWLYERYLGNRNEAGRLYAQCMETLETQNERLSETQQQYLRERCKRARARCEYKQSQLIKEISAP